MKIHPLIYKHIYKHIQKLTFHVMSQLHTSKQINIVTFIPNQLSL